MKCRGSKCQRDIPDDAVFCPYCGKKQEPEKRKRKKRINGSGSVYKLSGNRRKPYCAEKNGISIGTYKTYAEAQRELDRLVDTDVNAKFNLTFSEIYDRWKPEHYREISASQQGNYDFAFSHSAALHGRKFRDLRKSDFTSVIMTMERDGYAKSSCEKVLQLFGQLSQWAIDENIIGKNYSKNVRTVAVQKKEKIPFSAAELEAIKNCSMKGIEVLRIMIATGCRGKDLFTAKLADCKADYFISGSKSEAGYDRAIAVSDFGLDDYHTMVLMATVKGGSKLIDGCDCDHVYENWRKRQFSDIKAALGFPEKTPYNARHTYSTAAFASGMPQDLLARQMGHEDIKTTDKIYNHVDDMRTVTAGRKVKI